MRTRYLPASISTIAFYRGAEIGRATSTQEAEAVAPAPETSFMDKGAGVAVTTPIRSILCPKSVISSDTRHPMFSVRRLVRTDASAVLRINSDGYPGVARLDEPEFSRLCSLPNYHLAATDINGSLAGYSLAFARNAAYDGEEFLEFRLLSREPYLYIDQVAVAKESKGMGVGRALYDVLEEMARRDGAQALCCEVNTVPPNPESTAFHRALNFRRVGSFVTSDAREVELLLKRIP